MRKASFHAPLSLARFQVDNVILIITLNFAYRYTIPLKPFTNICAFQPTVRHNHNEQGEPRTRGRSGLGEMSILFYRFSYWPVSHAMYKIYYCLRLGGFPFKLVVCLRLLKCLRTMDSEAFSTKVCASIRAASSSSS